MKTNSHWHSILEDILYATQAGGYGLALHTAIKNKALRGQPLTLALTCGSCSAGLLVALDKIHHNHLERGASSPTVSCRCGHSAGHHYDGIQ